MLLKKYQDYGDLAALGQLYSRYLEYIFGVGLKIMPDEESAKDAVMQIFELLVEKLKSHQVTNFKSWLHSVTRNYCLEWLRKRKKFKQGSYSNEFMHSLQLLHPEDEEQVEPDFSGLHTCIERLNEDQKKCIELFYLQGYSYQEVAEKLEIDKDRVRSFIQNGRRNLKNCLKKTDERAY